MDYKEKKGGVYLEACHLILPPIFLFFIQITWKIYITKGLDAVLIYQSFKTQLKNFICNF